MAVDVGEAKGTLDLDYTQWSAGWSKAAQTAASQMKGIQDSSSNTSKNVGKKLSSIGTALSIGVTLPLVAVGKQMWTTASDFEASMSQVGAIAGAQGAEFDALRDKAVQLGKDTVFSSSEVADAMVEMAKAGWDTTQIINGMEGVLDAASASGENLSSVSTIMADAMTTFGIEASEATHVADVLTQSANKGTISISDIGQSLKYIGPSAAAAGFSFEDVNTAILAMSQSGIKASQAGTSLRSLFVNLVKPTDAMQAAMDELGISITNSDGTFKSLDDIVAQLRSSMSGLTDEQKAYYASVLAGKTGLSGMMSLINMSQEEYDELAASIDNCGGVADETAAIMQDNLKNDVEQLSGSLEALAITVMKNLEPVLRQFVQWLEGIVDWFTALDPQIQNAIVIVAALAAALGPVLVVLGGIIGGAQQVNNALDTLTKAFQSLSNIPDLLSTIASGAGKAFSMITSPVGIAVAAIGALVAAFIYLWNTNEDFRNAITEIWTGIVETLSGFFGSIGEKLAAVGITWDSVIQGLSTAWNTFCTMLAPVFEGAFQLISTVLTTVTEVILGLLDIFIGLFTGNWDQFWNGISTVFSAIWNGIVGVLQTVWNTIVGVVEAFLGLLGTNIETVLNNIANFFVTIWNAIVTTVQNVWNTIVSAISGFLQTIWNTITTIWNNIVNTITTVMNNIWNTIQSIWKNIQNTVMTVVTSIFQTVSSIWNNILSTISSIMSSIWNTISSIWNSIVSTVSSVVSSIWNAVSNAFNNVVSTISSAMESAKTGVSNGISNVLNFFSNLPSRILSALGNLGSLLWNAGSSIIDGLLNGLKSAIGGVYDFVSGIAGTIASLKGPIPYDKKLLITNGQAIMQGLEVGLEDGFGDVKKEVSGMASDIQKSMSGEIGTIPVDFDATVKNVDANNLFGDLTSQLADMSKYATEFNKNFSSDPQYSVYNRLDYSMLATKLAEVLRDAPISPQVSVEMNDGDIYMDAERVGRKVAPTVSRVQARGVKTK